ncbi:MAG: hypothetical protein EB824_06190 [Thaumarchaeota archaeon S15]|nr:MAG: hypothetical protein EB824_06190 [Thaumarchaeota archaeon S15]
MHGRVREVCARAGVRPTMPVNREFFATSVVGLLYRSDVRWAMLCSNRPRVASALREFSARRRLRVSESRISDGRGRVAPHVMAIEGRRPTGESPEGAYVAFVTRGPGVDVESMYPRRWGVEIGHRMVRQTRMRTPIFGKCDYRIWRI